MKATLTARTFEGGHFQFLPENGAKITKSARAKTKVDGAIRTDGNYPRVIVAGDVLAFDDKHALYAKKFYEVCQIARQCTRYAIDARITDDCLILTYSDGGMKTRVTLYWSANIGASLAAGYEVIFPFIDRDCHYPLFETESPRKVKRPASKRHAKYPTRPMLAKDWLIAVGASF